MPWQSLRNALLFNAVFSFACGVALLAMPQTIAALLGEVPVMICQILGVGLVLFAGRGRLGRYPKTGLAVAGETDYGCGRGLGGGVSGAGGGRCRVPECLGTGADSGYCAGDRVLRVVPVA